MHRDPQKIVAAFETPVKCARCSAAHARFRMVDQNFPRCLSCGRSFLADDGKLPKVEFRDEPDAPAHQ
ncbi:hypothetical protein [Polyangium jinanense]|uniref:Uncharacterized protein n=1 Tax=Polyangium jinanense TaxID=2829994 RepID=A0A9X3X4D3_9BACT|nr:hypothetical protein [Polyangium jinanense]MDC3954051.1 hypothetical protein [Polyangium jinanense]MDC3981993.1 hypothetical protein [Polyangium jinanense]